MLYRHPMAGTGFDVTTQGLTDRRFYLLIPDNCSINVSLLSYFILSSNLQFSFIVFLCQEKYE